MADSHDTTTTPAADSEATAAADTTPAASPFGLAPRWAMLLAVLLPLAYFGMIRATALGDAENSVDAYYHVAIAEQFPAAGFWRSLPAASFSIWSETYYDKEWLFHAYVGVTQAIARLAGQGGPGFTFSGLATLAVLLITMAVAMRRWRVPAPWLATLGLAVVSPLFLHRVLMLRPHIFGMSLVIAACLVYPAMSRKRWWWAVLLGFLSVLIYSNPHFIMLPAVVFAVLRWRRDRRLAILIPILSVAGIVLGMLIHPQSPNTLLLWKIQSVDVVRQIIVGDAPVVLANEASRPSATDLIGSVGAFVLGALNLLILAILLARRTRLAEETWAVGAISVIATIGVVLSQRAIEYAVPFGLLALMLQARDWFASREPTADSRLKRRLLLGTSVALVIALAALFPRYQTLIAAQAVSPYREVAAWLRAEQPPGTLLANVNWSEFPRLYYAAPEYRYLVGLDPMFGYHHSPEGMAALEAFRTGENGLRPAELQAIIQARYIFISSANHELARDLLKAGWTPVYIGADGWILDLAAPDA